MRKLLIGLGVIFSLLFVVTGCKEEYTTYEGAQFISFSDSLYVFPVQNDEDYFEVPVVATNTCDYDRTVAVEVVYKKTNAMERRHFTVESNTLTIPAGQKEGKFRLRGFASNINPTDSLGVNLHILEEEVVLGNQRMSANVILRKVAPLDINKFTGYAILTSTYMEQYMKNTKHKLVFAELDKENKNTIILRDYFYNGYDVKLKFDDENILEPLIEMDTQKFGPTSVAFGTIYGDGIIYMEQLNGYDSFYSTLENYLIHFMSLSVPGVGVVGQYGNLLEFISDEEAEKIKREGF